MKFGVVIFPGSNCDQDMIYVLRNIMQREVIELWHKQDHLDGFDTADCIVLPGGFSYGDYLRPGAIARFSPLMKHVIRFAEEGGYLLGICNGFQVLCESGLLPGVLLGNENRQFICRNTMIKVTSSQTSLTQNAPEGSVLNIPIAHADGCYFARDAVLDRLFEDGQVLFQYCDATGQIGPDSNPNGSSRNIAGICNENKNVFGMMPHPERAADPVLGNQDGRVLFESLIAQTVMA